MPTISRWVLTATITAATFALGAGAAHAVEAQGTPPPNSDSHLTIPITGECAGRPVTLVAGDSDHAAAQITNGGTGHLLPVSFTFIYADGSQFTDVVAPHNPRPTVSCELGGVGPDGSPVQVDVTAVWQQVGN